MYIPTIASGLPLVVAQNVRGRPAVYKVENNFHEFATAPEWRYKVTLSNDPRLPTERGLSEALSQLRHPRQASAFEHLRRRDVDSHRIVVGWDNIGSIRFEFGETQAVLHELWFTPKAETARGFLLPYTQHRVPFGVSNVSES
jgi:hypothetical protein